MPSEDDYGPTMNHEFFESGMSHLQHDTPNSVLPLAMTTQQPFLSVPGPKMGLSLCDVGPSFQGGREFDLEHEGNGAAVPPPPLPSYQFSNNTSPVSNSSPAAGRASSSSSHGLGNMGPTAAVGRPPKQRRIMPKSMNHASETIGIIGHKNASMQAAKRSGRRGPLPKKRKDKINRMREITACAACFASHVEVSCHRCDCRTIGLTVIQVL